MQQEEDWDREGLLDPAWEKQQRKVCFKNHLQTYISTYRKLTENFARLIF